MTQALNSVGGFSVGTGNSKITVIAANGTVTGTVSAANVTGAVANANNSTYAYLATYANTANAVAGANVSGTVGNAANANYALSADTANTANIANTANSVTGANITGEVANANFATYNAWSNVANTANIANTALSVNIANVTGLVNDLYELHVSSFGSDTAGNGAVYNPYKTIGKAVSVAAAGYSIIVHPGGYYEDVTIANLSTISISAVDSGGRGPFTPAIYGNLTISGNSSSISIKNVGVRNNLTHSASGTLYLSTLQLGSAGTVGTLTKSGNGYLAAQDCSFSLTSGANLTSVNITGSGSVLFSNVSLAELIVNNTNASVSVTLGSSTLSTTLTTGTLNVFDTYMYSLTNSGTHAVTSNGGVLNLRNSTLVKPNLSAATVNLSAGTVFAYGDVFFDRANSNIGINAGTTVDFQALRVSNTVTASTVAATAGTISLTPRSSAPSSPTAGTFAVADRTNWDPASKGNGAAYPVFYDGTVWTALY